MFAQPARKDVAWADVEGLLRALGAEISPGRGSRVRVALRGRKAVFHLPHPHRTCLPGMMRAVRDFLKEAGVHEP